ncbi:MAG TPA: PilZ domain-containing protein [Chthonomonadales bacterium]|nr:PilZ domain-containing protein [Chthonomonadales bacterium]
MGTGKEEATGGAVERRAHARVQVSAPAEYDAGAGWSACECLNVSPGGARLRCARPPSALTRIRLRLPVLRDAAQAEVEAVVLAVGDASTGGELSVKFVGLPPEVGLRLAQAMEAHRRPAV